ncbi:PREDICTED: protein TMEPAI [Dipodomys ordii]|uniref:Protein TMEPAI n=1 Tax=Dipodomys ordii TaxID=10020 RepID=A0A1S3FT54_DIPOR|nr:PREDICTED: protein TMEPAI [Dipodomys ordii]
MKVSRREQAELEFVQILVIVVVMMVMVVVITCLLSHYKLSARSFISRHGQERRREDGLSSEGCLWPSESTASGGGIPEVRPTPRPPPATSPAQPRPPPATSPAQPCPPLATSPAQPCPPPATSPVQPCHPPATSPPATSPAQLCPPLATSPAQPCIHVPSHLQKVSFGAVYQCFHSNAAALSPGLLAWLEGPELGAHSGTTVQLLEPESHICPQQKEGRPGRPEVLSTAGCAAQGWTECSPVQSGVSAESELTPELSTGQWPELSTRQRPELSTRQRPELSTRQRPELSTRQRRRAWDTACCVPWSLCGHSDVRASCGEGAPRQRGAGPPLPPVLTPAGVGRSDFSFQAQVWPRQNIPDMKKWVLVLGRARGAAPAGSRYAASLAWDSRSSAAAWRARLTGLASRAGLETNF